MNVRLVLRGGGEGESYEINEILTYLIKKKRK